MEHSETKLEQTDNRAPVHVVYGGAHLFKADTPQKLGRIALRSIEDYAANFAEFARAMWLKGADTLPPFADVIADLESAFEQAPETLKAENFNAWFAQTVYRKTIEKLENEPVEDFRIDFEDGYGLRADDEEDAHAVSASTELAEAFLAGTITAFSGFRIKSLARETRHRAIRTLDLFLDNFLNNTGGRLPKHFVVTLPKITRAREVEELSKRLDAFEKTRELPENRIKIEILVETPQAIFGKNGKCVLKDLVEAGRGRVNSAHFGAYDYTADLGIAGVHQHLRHDACNFARQMMLVALTPLNIRLSDSVTTEMPIPVHRGENLTESERQENKAAVQKAWRAHFNNITHSQINGFYQSWDLHPAQLAARYAAVYSFFLEAGDEQARRLKKFVEKATQAVTTGSQFDDAASAQGLVNFFVRALDAGAMTEEEIWEKTALTAEELRAGSFVRIMDNRNERAGRTD